MLYLVEFHHYYKKDNVLNFVCFPANQFPSERGFTLKEKNLLRRGANSFLLELTLSEGNNTLTELSPLKKYIFPFMHA